MQFELIAKTFQGLEAVLAQELIELGANNVQIENQHFSSSCSFYIGIIIPHSVDKQEGYMYNYSQYSSCLQHRQLGCLFTSKTYNSY